MDIGIDIDDVLGRWVDAAHRICEEAGITNGNVVTQWSFHNDYGCSSETLWSVLFHAYLDGMLLDLAPYEGVAADLSALQAAGHRVHLVTARGFEGRLSAMVRADTVEWLSRHAIPHDTLTFTKNKCDVATDYFIDDSITNVEALIRHGVTAYLRDQPHNQSASHLPRVASLHEFVRIIQNDDAGDVEPFLPYDGFRYWGGARMLRAA